MRFFGWFGGGGGRKVRKRKEGQRMTRRKGGKEVSKEEVRGSSEETKGRGGEHGFFFFLSCALTSPSLCLSLFVVLSLSLSLARASTQQKNAPGFRPVAGEREKRVERRAGSVEAERVEWGLSDRQRRECWRLATEMGKKLFCYFDLFRSPLFSFARSPRSLNARSFPRSIQSDHTSALWGSRARREVD